MDTTPADAAHDRRPATRCRRPRDARLSHRRRPPIAHHELDAVRSRAAYLQNRSEVQDGTVLDLEEEIYNNNERIRTLEAENDQQKKRIAELQTNNTQLDDDLKRLSGLNTPDGDVAGHLHGPGKCIPVSKLAICI